MWNQKKAKTAGRYCQIEHGSGEMKEIKCTGVTVWMYGKLEYFLWEMGNEQSSKKTGAVRFFGVEAREKKRYQGEERPHPMGVNVSMPLAAAHGRPFDFATSWTFLAVMSTARASKKPKSLRRDPEMGSKTHCSRQCGSVHPLGGCLDRVLRSRGQVRLEGVREIR
jgi:hypothetical protein